jgi:outer membrane translocation and assembly module TamA
MGRGLPYLEVRETRAYISCMSARGFLPILPLLFVFLPSATGQLPKRVERCLPYPTLVQEIREMEAPNPEPPRVRVHVIRVEFNPGDGILASVQGEISTHLRSQVFERNASATYLKELAEEIAEVGVVGALQNSGYFRARATAKLTALGGEGTDIDVAVAISVTPGKQYRTGKVRIESADDDVPLGIPAEALRKLIPLQRGELFSAEKARMGMETLTRAYSRVGYVDMVPVPKAVIDEGLTTIDLVYRIEQGMQYRVGTVEFLGVASAMGEKLRESLPKSGEVFDEARLEEFFTANRAILPSDATRDDVTIRRDVGTRTVAMLFDFRTCPLDSN